MNIEKSLDGSHEPMEIEEISDTEPVGQSRPFIKTEKDPESPKKSKPKNILRESILTNVLNKEQKNGGPDAANQDRKSEDKKAEIISESPESRETIIISDDVEILSTKSKLRPLVNLDEPPSEEKEIRSFYDFWRMLFFILIPIALVVVCVSIVREEFDDEICALRFDATSAIRDLENRVYGQPKAIEELGFHLSIDFRGLKLLALTGGTGTGKSYAAHIISENFTPKKKVFQYVPPLKHKRRFALNAISICGCNLIIIENLNNKDISDAADFVEYIAGKVDNRNYCVYIIEVINVQETDNNLNRKVDLAKSKVEIKNIHRNKNLDVKVIQFQRLDDEAVTKCILDAGKSSNITLTESEIDDVRIGLKISDTGCKGARAKVHLLNNKSGFV